MHWRDTIFVITHGGRLDVKVDEGSNDDYLARGMGPFRPNERQTIKSYYVVPAEVLAGPEALLSWVREAIRAGQVSLGRPRHCR